MGLSGTDNVKIGDTCALETKFQCGNNTKNKEKVHKLASTACFTNIASWTHTVLERAWTLYSQIIPVALTALHGATEMEYGVLLGYTYAYVMCYALCTLY